MSGFDVVVENVGGIDELAVSVPDGVTFVTGVNASNKTSLLRAILFALGGPAPPIKTDAEEARVRLERDGDVYERTARRHGAGVRVSGDAVVADEDDRELLERFAALTADNPLRRAVETDGDVERLLKEPMDVEALRREQRAKMERKRELQTTLDESSDVDDDLAAARDDLEAARERASDLETRLDDLHGRRTVSDDVDDEVVELRERRASLAGDRDALENRVADLEAAVERLDEQLEARREQLEAARETADEEDVTVLRARREDLREDLHDVEHRIDILQSVLTANREMLDAEFTGALGRDASIEGDRYTCWACGNDAPAGDFEETVSELEDLVAADKRCRREVEPDLDEIDDRIAEAERARRRVEDLEAEVGSLSDRRDTRAESLSNQRDRLREIRDELAALDEEIADAERDRDAERTDLGADIEAASVDLATARRDVDRLEERVASLEDRAAERREAAAELDAVTDEIQRLTERIQSLEAQLREEFNAATADLIDALAFERIDRVWLDGDFDVVVAREVDGAVREDSLEHLAESERAMIGLVLALAGFVAYDVGAVTPAVVLDSLGAFDAERTRRLVEYFGDRAEVLLAAVHPEVAGEGDVDANQVRFRVTVDEETG